MASRMLATAVVLAATWGASAQIEDPVTWNFDLYPSAEEGLHDLVIHATVDSCWHIYSQDNDPDNGLFPRISNSSGLRESPPRRRGRVHPLKNTTQLHDGPQVF